MLRPAPTLAVGLLVACGSGVSETPPTSAPVSVASAADPGAVARDPLEAPVDVAAPPADAQRTASGLAYKVLASGGSADKPGRQANVTVHYTGWTTDGKRFDSSVERNEPARFPLDRVIAGWTEGLQLMAKGDRFRLWIPEELAYKGVAGRPQGMLVFDVELLDFLSPPEAPADVAAAPADAQRTKSGLAYKVLSAGGGADRPTQHSQVRVHYSGWTTDGNMFDSSVARGEPASFPLLNVIPGWTEGLQLMAKGDRFRFWIPEELAYKDQPGRPQGTLVFDVELLDFKELPKPPETPKDVAAPPADAKKTATGLAYKVLEAGAGGDKPKASSRVTVHYSGWTTDGNMFDSSVVRGRSATFPLDGVIAGWTEGLQLMSPGDRYRFWIPEELAYKGQSGKPKGMLVFDVELVEVK